MSTDKSFFLYLHNDLSGDSEWKKLGKGMTPYSVVRARQKFCSKKFELTQLWFGHPSHIHYLEDVFKKHFYRSSGAFLNDISAQTEMFKMSADDIVKEVNKIIVKNKLQVGIVTLDTPYSASNSSSCPFKIPSENKSHAHLSAIVQNSYGDVKALPKKLQNNMFAELFGMD